MRKKKTEQPLRGKRIVSVCSPTPGSGVTLTGLALACVMAQGASVCFAEAGKPYVFDAFGMGKTFLLSGFTDYFQLFSEGKPFPAPSNLWRGVSWAVRPGFADSLPPKLQTADEILRFAEKLPGSYTVLDCSGLDGSLLEGVLAGSDRVWLVVDPLPGKLLPASPALQRLRYAFPGAVLAVNRQNPGIHKRELDAYLGTSDYLALPDIGAETIYRAEYACVLPWDLPEGRRFFISLKNHQESAAGIGPGRTYMV